MVDEPLATTTLQMDEPIDNTPRPVWQGPQSDGSQGGISQSLISAWLECRERFRIRTVEGLQQSEGFSAPLEYGNLWHEAEEAFANRANAGSADLFATSTDGDWTVALNEAARKMMDRYPFDREKVAHWHGMAMRQFPVYVQHWAQHPDMTKRTPLLSEQTFKVPYLLPSGRTVYLRGKIDSADTVEEGEQEGEWLQENKTKSGIDAQAIQRQLKFDLQTLTYSIAFTTHLTEGKRPFRGVRYNVIRRSAHKTPESMVKKLVEDMQAGRAGEWFARWNVEITEHDIARFKRTCLDPILENICDDYEWWAWCLTESPFELYKYDIRHKAFPHHQARHFVLPYGCYMPIHQGGIDAVDRYIETGSDAGLVRVKNLFPELTDE